MAAFLVCHRPDNRNILHLPGNLREVIGNLNSGNGRLDGFRRTTVAGSRFGKTKLAPSISPNKSWEGVFGGMLLGLAMALVLNRLAGQLSLTQWIVVALACTVFGTMGDLAESKLKRTFHTKDSGGLLPGHGGFLDRFDSLFFVAPVAWLLVRFVF